MRMKKQVLISFMVLGFASISWGRVFDFNKENFAAYLRGSYLTVPNMVGEDSPFETSGGNGVEFDTGFKTGSAGEFGFIYSSKVISLKFGIEVLKPTILNVVGSSAADVEYYKLKSDVSVVAPKVGIELNLKQWPQSKLFLTLDFGTANIVIKNAYSLNATGATALSAADFDEDVRGNTSFNEGGLGYEMLMSDSTTFAMDVGYRSMNFASLKHNKDVTTFQGAFEKGDVALDNDGNKRSTNLTGYYAGVWFRFWVK